MSKPAWSYSSLTAFELCPRKYYETRVAKTVKEPETEVLRWGNAVHKALEERLRDGKELPKDMAQWEPLAAKLEARTGEIKVEQQLCVNHILSPTDWFGKDAWCRGVVDFMLIDDKKILALDWKTGKPKTDHDQLKLFAALLFHHYPAVEKVVTGYVWLAHGNKITTETFTRASVSDIWGEYLPRVRRLEHAMANDKWIPKPSGICRGWCYCTGCEFNQRK